MGTSGSRLEQGRSQGTPASRRSGGAHRGRDLTEALGGDPKRTPRRLLVAVRSSVEPGSGRGVRSGVAAAARYINQSPSFRAEGDAAPGVIHLPRVVPVTRRTREDERILPHKGKRKCPWHLVGGAPAEPPRGAVTDRPPPVFPGPAIAYAGIVLQAVWIQ